MTEKIVEEIKKFSKETFEGDKKAEKLFWIFILAMLVLGSFVFFSTFLKILNLLLWIFAIVAIIKLMFLAVQEISVFTHKNPKEEANNSSENNEQNNKQE